jgi:hypothetical protein
MPKRTSGEIVAAILSELEVLEVEAARLVVLAKATGEDGVLGKSASLVYETVAAMSENLKQLRKLKAFTR